MDQDVPSHAQDAPGAKFGDDMSPAENVPTTTDHGAGAPEADSSEPQIPRLGEGGTQPGAHDPTKATADGPVLSAGIADQAGADPEAQPIVGDQEQGATGSGGTSGAGRAVASAFAKNRQPQQQQQAMAGQDPGRDTIQGSGQGADQQQQDFQGAGYPTADIDGRAGDVTTDMDPEASAVAPPMAPVEDGPAEEEPEDTSIIGDGHADKAAWNRARTEAPQPGYDAVVSGGPGALGSSPSSRTPGSSEDMGYPGGAPAEEAPGLDTGDGTLDELVEDEDIAEDENLEDATDALDDDTGADQGIGGAPGGQRMSAARQPRLPEDAEQPDEGRSAEDLLIADDNEDAMFAQGELGDTEDLEMEELNETDDIANDFEDQRPDMDDAASGNERSTM